MNTLVTHMVLVLPDFWVYSRPAEHEEMLYLLTRPAFDAVVRQPIKQSGIADKALSNISISFERTGSRPKGLALSVSIRRLQCYFRLWAFRKHGRRKSRGIKITNKTSC